MGKRVWEVCSEFGEQNDFLGAGDMLDGAVPFCKLFKSQFFFRKNEGGLINLVIFLGVCYMNVIICFPLF